MDDEVHELIPVHLLCVEIGNEETDVVPLQYYTYWLQFVTAVLVIQGYAPFCNACKLQVVRPYRKYMVMPHSP